MLKDRVRDIAHLDRKIIIQFRSEQRTDEGAYIDMWGYERDDTSYDGVVVWAQHIPLQRKQQETIMGAKETEYMQHQFVVRYNKILTKDDYRILLDDKVYNVIGASMQGRFRYLRIVTEYREQGVKIDSSSLNLYP